MYRAGYRLLFLALLCGAIFWEPLDPDALPYGLRRSLSRLPVFGQSRRSDDLTHLGFDHWPNKTGPSKSEFVFSPSDALDKSRNSRNPWQPACVEAAV